MPRLPRVMRGLGLGLVLATLVLAANLAAGAETDAMSRARTLADELRKSNPSLTKEIALAKVFDTHPDLAAAIYAR